MSKIKMNYLNMEIIIKKMKKIFKMILVKHHIINKLKKNILRNFIKKKLFIFNQNSDVDENEEHL